MVNTVKKSSVSDFFSRFKRGNKEKSVSTKTGGGGVRAFMSKLSGAFLLPISVLSIAGLLLGVGATIEGNVSSGAAKDFGAFIKQMGDPIFGILPLLFAVAVTISFTEEAGVAVFNAILAYAVFSGLQSVFIKEVKVGETSIGYSVLFGGAGRSPEELAKLVGTSLGIKSLQTSVFGGIIIGFIVQWAYHKFHTIKLPQWLAFYSGKRFVAFPVIGLMVPTTFLFLIIWPYIGFVFNAIGKNSGKIGFGFDSFIFGFIERTLVPFGLHHVFYSPLWYTEAGGNLQESVNDFIAAGNVINKDDLESLAQVLKGDVLNGNIVGSSVFGDSTTSLALLGFNGNDVRFQVLKDGKLGAEQSQPLLMFIQDQLGLKIGRFMQGKFSFMQWGLPAAAAAMIVAAPKENRRAAMGTVVPAAVTSFVTGVTEPIEFTFLFLAPFLFFGFHAFMCALSFMLMNVMNVHLAQSFSGGFLDLVLYGMVPVLKGTNFWWTIVVGLAYAPIYYFVFFFWIKKADLATPGRGGNTKLFTKKDYLDRKDGANQEANADGSVSLENGADSGLVGTPKALAIIDGYGGVDNILKTANCASRLRFDVKDASLVDIDKLKSAGAYGVQKVSPTHVQAVFGPESETLKTEIDHALKSRPAEPKPAAEVEVKPESVETTPVVETEANPTDK